jgi:apolipoprotein N-acyltransferase
MDPRGIIISRSDKVRMTPGMEWGGFMPGDPGVTHPTRHHAVGVLVCYESLFGGLARSLGRAGATILANLTSDIWFGSGESGPSSIFLRQHPAHLVMRAVETRAGVARAANGGFSFLLDPAGRPVSDIVPPEGGLTWNVLPVTGQVTLFTRLGDLLGPVVCLATLVLIGLPLLKTRRRSRGQRPRKPPRGSYG